MCLDVYVGACVVDVYVDARQDMCVQACVCVLSFCLFTGLRALLD